MMEDDFEYAIATLQAIALHHKGSSIQPSLVARTALVYLGQETENNCPNCGSKDTSKKHFQAHRCNACECEWLGPGLIKFPKKEPSVIKVS